jgi:hypothetical protein
MIASQRVIQLLQAEAGNTQDEGFAKELQEAARVLGSYHFLEAYRQEVEYTFEMIQEYDDDEFIEELEQAEIELTEDEVDNIADMAWNNDWLNEQISDVMREYVMDLLNEKLETAAKNKKAEEDIFNES